MYYEDYALDILFNGHIQLCWVLERQFHQRIEIRDELVCSTLYPVYRRKWDLRLLYYKPRKQRQVKSQVLQRKPPFYCSGFVSRERGIHRNFQRRRARN